jgi:arabinofuranosyltransferase
MPRGRTNERLVLAGALALVLVVLVRTAWVADDAYITFRCVDQWLHGHGARWNIGERVQAYTHPLWFVLLTGVTAAVREPYYAALILGAVCTLSVAALIAARAPGQAASAFGIVALLASKAFVDYSTSGLENPLTNLLLGLFVTMWWTGRADPPSDRSTLRLALLASLLLTNRLDAGLIVLPALVARLARLPRRAAVRTALVGMLPFAIWETLSLFYYGFPFPNTAYAKLSTGIPPAELMRQGVAYFGESLQSDPITLPIVAAGIVAGIAGRSTGAWPLSLGLMLYLAYVLRVGGDFMSGRFFVAPFVAAVLILAHATARAPRLVLAAACAVLVVGLRAPRVAALSGPDYSVTEGSRAGIQDERGYYYQRTGLLRRSSPWRPPADRAHRVIPSDIPSGRFVAVQDVIGIYGYTSPPGLHIIDVLGLADPLLARLPCERPWRIGHYYRAVPDGYLDTIETGSNRLRDPQLAAYYDKLQLVVRGPLWSLDRLATVIEFNIGRYDHLLPAAPH